MGIRNKRLSEDEFLRKRQEVLRIWPTGDAIDLDEAIDFQKTLPSNKVAAHVISQAKKDGVKLVQPRGGVSGIEEHIELVKYLQDHGGADLLPTTIDSYTRNARYEEISRVLEARGPGLNGLPAVNYGVEACRRIVEALERPVVARTCAPYGTLLAEVLLAAGFSSMEGGGITCLIPYAKKRTLEDSMLDWQYVARLIGYYQEKGVTIHRESYGPLTGILVPPCVSIAIGVIECLLDAEQGVSAYSIGYGMGGNLIQDVAAVRAALEVAEEYLDRFNLNVEITAYFHQYMGAFPPDQPRAISLISLGAVAAALSDATVVITKSPSEAHGIPTKEANTEGLQATRHVLQLLEGQTMVDSTELRLEQRMIKEAVRALLERTLELGDGDLAQGTLKAFQAGVLDVPFSPSRENASKVVACKDLSGAVRLMDPGHLPLPSGVLEYEREKIAERQSMGACSTYDMLLEDIRMFTDSPG